MMGKRITVPIAIEAPANSDSKYILWKVDYPAVVVKEIELVFESGTFNVLFASLYYGDMKVAPRVGEYTSLGGVIRDKVDVPYFKGDPILLRVRNTDSANPHKLSGSLEVEVVEEVVEE